MGQSLKHETALVKQQLLDVLEYAVSELPTIYLTYGEAGEMLRCGKRTVGRKVKAGELQARGKGKGKRVVYESVLKHPDYTPEVQ